MAAAGLPEIYREHRVSFHVRRVVCNADQRDQVEVDPPGWTELYARAEQEFDRRIAP